MTSLGLPVSHTVQAEIGEWIVANGSEQAWGMFQITLCFLVRIWSPC